MKKELIILSILITTISLLNTISSDSTVCTNNLFSRECNNNGNISLEVFGDRFWNGTDYQTIDTTIKPYNVGGYDNFISSAPYKLFFKNNTNTAGAVRFESDGYFFTYDISGGELHWRGTPTQTQITDTLGGGVPSNSQNTQIEPNGNIAVYPGAFSNTNLTYQVKKNMLKETFILTGLPSIKNYLYLEYTGNIKFNASLDICANGICYVPSGTQDNFNTSGQIDFRDSNNQTIFFVPPPIIRDSDGKTTKGIYDVLGSNAQMQFRLRIPTDFIRNASFPIN